jgi:uncharacterized protein with ATP-grasp and redox domains
VADNAGEIGFDSLAIHQIKGLGPKVTLVVKKQTFFEDATLEDANAFGLEKLVDEIITVPGFLVPDEMDEHTAASFQSSDLVISKGTGSDEALHGEIRDKKAVLMLKVKCGPIARELELNEGEHHRKDRIGVVCGFITKALVIINKTSETSLEEPTIAPLVR